jgi:DNA repair exonuclease SbcCD ATPase subunit
MAKVDIEIPSLDVRFDLDFSSIEQHHQQAIALEQEISARQEQIDSLASDISQNSANAAALEMARQAVNRAERQIEQLGPQPHPTTRSKRVKVSDGGMYGDDEYETVERTDYSNVESWKESLGEQRKALDNKESRLAQIAAEEERKTGMRLSLERAQKKYEREITDFERKKAEMERQEKQAKADLAEDAARRLLKSTAGQLDQRIGYLENHAGTAIDRLFNDQLSLLHDCVQEQYMEPLNAKRARREEVQALLQQSQITIAQRKAQLAAAQKDLADLQALTHAALNT